MQLTVVANPFAFIALAKIASKAAKEAMKTSKGSKKAITTLNTTEGLLASPNCR